MVLFVKKGITKLWLALAAAIVAASAASVWKAGYPSATAVIIIPAFFFAWIVYSVVAARLFAKGIAGSLSKALFLDSLTYLPFVITLAAKLASSHLNLEFGNSYFGQLPLAFAFWGALAVSVAMKIIFLPKNAEPNDGRRAKIAVIGGIAAYFLFFSIITVLRHLSLNSTAFDLAIFDQTIWGYSTGHIIFNTVRGLNLLGDHMHPLLFLFAPLYKLIPMPEGLLVLQSLGLALGALPIYLIARKRLGNTVGAMISLTYLIYPTLQYLNMFDFHPETFATPLLLFAIYFADAKKYFRMIVMLVLAGMAKEQMPLALASIGAYVFLAQKKRKLGTLMALGGLAWFILNFKVLLPHFYGSTTYAHIIGYEYLGSTPLEMIKNAILHPQIIISHLLTIDRLVYISLLLLPLGFGIAAILGLPYLLLAAPFFAINLLKTQNMTTTALYQYNAELIPFIFLAAIMGAQKLARWLARLKIGNARLAVGTLVLLTL